MSAPWIRGVPPEPDVLSPLGRDVLRRAAQTVWRNARDPEDARRLFLMLFGRTR